MVRIPLMALQSYRESLFCATPRGMDARRPAFVFCGEFLFIVSFTGGQMRSFVTLLLTRRNYILVAGAQVAGIS
jgi:hypothetical protein